MKDDDRPEHDPSQQEGAGYEPPLAEDVACDDTTATAAMVTTF